MSVIVKLLIRIYKHERLHKITMRPEAQQTTQQSITSFKTVVAKTAGHRRGWGRRQLTQRRPRSYRWRSILFERFSMAAAAATAFFSRAEALAAPAATTAPSAGTARYFSSVRFTRERLREGFDAVALKSL